MASEGRKNKVEQTASDISSYVNMKVDAVKLDAVGGLSKLCANIFGILILVTFAIVALLMLFAVLGYWIGTLINSIAWGFVIVAAFLLIVGLLAFRFKQKIFSNIMVGTFAQMFFPITDNKEEYYEKE